MPAPNGWEGPYFGCWKAHEACVCVGGPSPTNLLDNSTMAPPPSNTQPASADDESTDAKTFFDDASEFGISVGLSIASSHFDEDDDDDDNSSKRPMRHKSNETFPSLASSVFRIDQSYSYEEDPVTERKKKAE